MFVSFPDVFIVFHLPDTQKVPDNNFQLNKWLILSFLIYEV